MPLSAMSSPCLGVHTVAISLRPKTHIWWMALSMPLPPSHPALALSPLPSRCPSSHRCVAAGPLQEYLFRVRLTRRVALRERSPVLMASAKHHRSDAMSSVAAAVGTCGAFAAMPPRPAPPRPAPPRPASPRPAPPRPAPPRPAPPRLASPRLSSPSPPSGRHRPPPPPARPRTPLSPFPARRRHWVSHRREHRRGDGGRNDVHDGSGRRSRGPRPPRPRPRPLPRPLRARRWRGSAGQVPVCGCVLTGKPAGTRFLFAAPLRWCPVRAWLFFTFLTN